MIFPKDDLPIIRKSVVFLGLALLAGAIVHFGAGYLVSYLDHLRQEADAGQQAARDEFEAAGREAAQRKTYAAPYTDLVRRGRVIEKESQVEELRLKWLEAVRSLPGQIGHYPLSYDMKPQEVLALPVQVSSENYQVAAAPVDLSMPLLHMGDWFRLVDTLAQANVGRPMVAKCAFSRSLASQLGPPPPELKVDCRINWVAVGKPSAGQGEEDGSGS